MGRKGTPGDYVVDADRGSGGVRAKQARTIDTEVANARADARAGLRELDAMVEGSGLGRLQKDRERLAPRATVGELGHPRMERQAQGLGEARRPISDRQKKARSKTRREVQGSIPLTQVGAQRDLVTRPEVWREVNDALSENAGDIQALPERDQEHLRRVDRSIQSYERSNDRGHVVYVPVQLPHYINSSNLDSYVRKNFGEGSFAFDRYTVGTHQLHEAVDMYPGGGMAYLEIPTRRGAYLGRSDRMDNTKHLLPRSMEGEYTGAGRVSYTDRQGKRGSVMVIQARDTTPEI